MPLSVMPVFQAVWTSISKVTPTVARRKPASAIGSFFYNERLHQALGYRVPMAVWRKRAPPKACGYMDNANSLTTCPQADQKQQQTERTISRRASNLAAAKTGLAERGELTAAVWGLIAVRTKVMTAPI